jgi:hypothetical protein
MRQLNSSRRNLPLVLTGVACLLWGRAAAAQVTAGTSEQIGAVAPQAAAAPSAVATGAPVPTPTNSPEAATLTSQPAPVVPSVAPTATSAPPSASPVPRQAPAPVEPATPAVPLSAHFDVGVVVQTNWNTAAAYDFFSDDDILPKGGLSIGADVLNLTGTILAFDVNVLFGQTDSQGPLPNYIDSGAMDETDLGAGLTVRHEIFRWLAPQARLGGGLAFQDAVLSGTDFGASRQKFTTGYLSLGGGLSFTSPAHRLSRTRAFLNSVALRVIVEGGYQWGQDLQFAVKGRAAGNGGAPNAVAAIPLGVLQQSGPYLRVAAQARF